MVMNLSEWLEWNRNRELQTLSASFKQVGAPPNKAKRMEKSTKEKSWTRQEYEAAYVWMRRGVTFDWLVADDTYSQCAIKAADYSYQGKDIDVHGWSSNAREKRFFAIKWRIMSHQCGLSS